MAIPMKSTRRSSGRKVELVFDPFDLTRIEVRLAGVPMGLAIRAPRQPPLPPQGQNQKPRASHRNRPVSTTRD